MFHGESSRTVWWLILSVHFTGIRNARIAGKTLFLDVLVMCFWMCLEKISIWSIDWLKKIVLPNVGGHHSVHWGPGLHRRKRQRKEKFPLSAWAVTASCSCPWTSKLLVLQLSDWDWGFCPWTPSSQVSRLRLNYTPSPSAFLIPQLGQGRLWDFSDSITTRTNSYDISSSYVGKDVGG